MITWHWVRHGPTHEKNFVGWRDVPADLSDTAQIARLNAALPQTGLVVASDLRRASATADVLSPGRDRLPDDPSLREFNFGDWDGKHFSEVAESHPDLSRAYWERPGDIAPPGGESWNEAARRINKAVDTLLPELAAGAHIIAVAHIGVILTQIQRAHQVGAEVIIAQKIDNLSVTTLTHDNGIWQTGRINHLP